MYTPRLSFYQLMILKSLVQSELLTNLRQSARLVDGYPTVLQNLTRQLDEAQREHELEEEIEKASTYRPR